MTTYESDVKTISSNEEVVFDIISDLNNLKKLQESALENEQVKDLTFDTDSCSFVVEGFGKMGLRVIEREALKTIKLQSEGAPVQINAWIQLKALSENETAMRITLKAELPMMIKMMVDKKLQEGLNKVADLLAVGLSPKS